jgi:hypothetical protein
MTEQSASQGATTALPTQSANATARPVPDVSSPPESGPMQTRVSGIRTSLAAAGAARITRLRQILRRDRPKPPAG